MREYELSEVEFLQAQEEVIDVHGAKVLVKKSPKESRPGCLDPHELEIMKAIGWQGRNGRKKREKSCHDAGGKPQMMRDNMGFPNTICVWKRYIPGLKLFRWAATKWDFGAIIPGNPNGSPASPALCSWHGGGWVGGTPYTVENPCRLLAELADAVVFNVDYSLAPEKKFPNGFDDALAQCSIFTSMQRSTGSTGIRSLWAATALAAI